MRPPTSEVPPRNANPPPWLTWRNLLIFGGVYTLILCIAVTQRETLDFDDFWQTALQFRQTGEISADLGVHNYLPFFTIFMTPWSYLPLRVAAPLFVAFSCALFALTVVLAETLLTSVGPISGRSTQAANSTATPASSRCSPPPRPATLFAILLALPYVHASGVLGQMALLLVFLVIATWFLVERGHEWTAGAALGLAILIKLLPAILLVFFLIKGRWRVLTGALLTTLLLGIGLPLLRLGPAESWRLHDEFFDRAVEAGGAHATIHAEKPQKAKYTNNALPIVLRRLLTHVNADPSDQEPERELYVDFADLPVQQIWRIYIGLAAILGLGSILVTLRHRRDWPWSQSRAAIPEAPAESGVVDNPIESHGSAEPNESNASTNADVIRSLREQYAVWCCLMLIAAPLVWTHYLPLVYWPLACLLDRVERTHRETNRHDWLGILAGWIWFAAILLLAWPAARAAGAQLAAVTILWLTLCLQSLRPQQSRRDAVPRTP